MLELFHTDDKGLHVDKTRLKLSVQIFKLHAVNLDASQNAHANIQRLKQGHFGDAALAVFCSQLAN